jgi:hypothetical protein
MHYDSIENKHGLPHDPFKAIVAPRPIGWIGSVSKAGVNNLAPYSYFNDIPQVCKSWKRAAQQEFLWQTFGEREFGLSRSLPALRCGCAS